MINFKPFKLCCGIMIAVTLGLSGCSMDSQSYEHADNVSQSTATTTPAPETKKVAKSVVKEPIQQTTPGPKRSAAPQIPVIQ